jgi:hypothetical protein
MLTLEGLKKELAGLNMNKDAIQAQFHQICGAISVVTRQIEMIEKAAEEAKEAQANLPVTDTCNLGESQDGGVDHEAAQETA